MHVTIFGASPRCLVGTSRCQFFKSKVNLLCEQTEMFPTVGTFCLAGAPGTNRLEHIVEAENPRIEMDFRDRVRKQFRPIRFC